MQPIAGRSPDWAIVVASLLASACTDSVTSVTKAQADTVIASSSDVVIENDQPAPSQDSDFPKDAKSKDNTSTATSCTEGPAFSEDLFPPDDVSPTVGIHHLPGTFVPTWIRWTAPGVWLATRLSKADNTGAITRHGDNGSLLQTIVLTPSLFPDTTGVVRMVSNDAVQPPDGNLVTVGRAETSTEPGGPGPVRCWFGRISAANGLTDVHVTGLEISCERVAWAQGGQQAHGPAAHLRVAAADGW
jgi:hypothetical protein